MKKFTEFLKKHKKGLIILAVILVLVIFLARSCAKGMSQITSMMGDMAQHPAVRDLTVSIAGNGTILPNDQYTITPMVQGEIVEAPFEEGEVVEKGQLLYQFSTDNVKDSIEAAELAVEQAASSLEDAKNSERESKENLKLTAEVEGYVKNLYVEKGDMVSAGMTVAEVYDNTTMVLELPFNDAEIEGKWTGKKAKVYVGGEEELISGRVTKVAAYTTAMANNMVVRYVTIEVKNPGGIGAETTATASVAGVDCNSGGTFRPKSEGTVIAAGSGRLENLFLEEGAYLHKGDVYATLEEASGADPVKSYEYSLRSAENQLASSQKNLEDYSITAPISGTVISKKAKAGDNINGAFTGSLAVIYDLSRVKFTMNVDELDVLKIAVGQEVQVTADALEGVEMTGHITNISLEAMTTGGVTSYPVTVEMDEVGNLLPGMNVSAEIVLSEKKNVLTIPTDALMRGDVVYLLNGEGQTYDKELTFEGDPSVPVGYHKASVETGISNNAYVEILSGLTEEDSVYVPSSQTNGMFMINVGGDPYAEESGYTME
ncbi:MAG: HlyD family efflux transporter periplasmic adaptor subunit [Muribaculaceae bacterium]|nr:HlyD family efflux transporter periplasmic adaptor subunit [Roseburia sp.]MCM1432078.1 HlyD family efflux transporter periplasmic adaptor subunit [Muribaculaceae bacterium]MCM1492122.1 HlyD family efflux transporter periplasmic adaptor subunit [Muribaculaceae bacterium]